jgi:multiple sugar transport system permease protein
VSALRRPSVRPARRPSRRRADRRRRGLVLLLMSPWIFGFSIFFAYPIATTAYLSFTHYDLLSSPKFIGLDNYRFMLDSDPRVWPAIRNTLWFIAVSVPARVLFAIGIALMLARIHRGAGVARTIFYLPALVPPVAATLGFVYLLNPATGPVNAILDQVGITGPNWFQSPTWAKPSLVLLSLWAVGNVMVIFLAAVLDVPRQLYEAADIDGAGPLQRLRHITLPAISPVILFAVVIGVIESLQYFTQAYVASQIAVGQASQAGSVSTAELGYPLGSTLFYPILLYDSAFRRFTMGYASALTMVLLVVAFVVTYVIVRRSRSLIHHEGAL